MIGRTTEACLEGGLFWAAVGLVESGVAQATRELDATPRVFATGGDAPLIGPHCPTVQDVLPNLTLQGLQLALSAAHG